MMTAAWREQAQKIAQERAQTEARIKWRLGADAAIPFDYRWEHVQSTVGLALWLADELNADREVVEAAAWLHDIAKMNEPHEINGAHEAEQLLSETDFPPHKIAAVAHAIRMHRGLTRDEPETPLQPLEAAILWDADKLSKIGVAAMVTILSSPSMSGMTLAERRRKNDDFVENVLSRTVQSMNTEPARQLADLRYRNNKAAQEAWRREEMFGGENF